MGNGKNGFLPALNLENGNKMEIKWILTTLEKWKKNGFFLENIHVFSIFLPLARICSKSIPKPFGEPISSLDHPGK